MDDNLYVLIVYRKSMEQFILKSDDVNKEKLKTSWIAEKIKLQSDLSSLHNDILWVKKDEKENKNTDVNVDIFKLKSYLESVKNKERTDIKNQWSAISFAVQLFLKNQWLYKDGRIDGIFWPKTYSAVRLFQEKWNIENPGDKIEKVDWFVGKFTIDKILKVLYKELPKLENDVGMITSNPDIKLSFDSLNEIQKLEFKSWRYTIETDRYYYKFVDGGLHRTNKPIAGSLVLEEVLFSDGKWRIPEAKIKDENLIPKAEKKENISEKKEKKHSLHFEISSEFWKLSLGNQKLFWEGKYIIESNWYFYFFSDNEIQKDKDLILVKKKIFKDNADINTEKQNTEKQNTEKQNTEKQSPFNWSIDSRDRNDVRKYIKEIYESELDLDYLLDSEMVFDSLRIKFLDKNKDKISKDPYISSYMLYKSIKWIWTNNKVISWIFENYSWDWDVLENVFWTPDWDSLMQRLDSDYSDKGLVKLFQSKLSPWK